MKEVDIQTQICDAVNNDDLHAGKAFKMSNQFIVGVPDLFIKTWFWQTALVEVKYEDNLPKRGSIFLTDRNYLTHKQITFIKTLIKARAPWGLMMVAKLRTGVYSLLASNSIWPYGTEVFLHPDKNPSVLVKSIGGNWPINEAMDIIMQPLHPKRYHPQIPKTS